MEKNNDENFINRKRLLMQINSGQLIKNLLYYINEARTSPKDFSRHLMINDDIDEKIENLSLFFKYSSIKVPPLVLEPNLEKCSQELLYHIISIDDGSSMLKFNQEEKEKNCLKERLKRLNLIPTYHIDLLIIGVNNSIEALSDILLNKNHRKKILNPEMKYIGIAAGLLPSEKLCFVIDIVHSLNIYNNFLYRRKNYNFHNYMNDIPNKKNYPLYDNYYDEDDFNNDNVNDNDTYEEDIYRKNIIKINNNKSYSQNNKDFLYFDFNPNFNSDKKIFNKKRFFNSVGAVPYNNQENNRYNSCAKNNKKEEIIDLRISNQKSVCPSHSTYIKNDLYYRYPEIYKIPISVSIEKKYAKNQYGNIFPIYSKESKYDDGSILIQPYPDE